MSETQDPSGSPGIARQVNVATDHGRIYAVQHGNQYVYVYPHEAPYHVGAFSTAAAPVAADHVRRVPSWLLAASHRVVPFSGRQEEFASLVGWRDDSNPRVSVRLLHAPGGHGKTRLTMQFAELSSEAGWTVAAARHRSDFGAPRTENEQLTVRSHGLLMVVDYAERWPLQDLIRLLREHLDADAALFRVLLLARPAGEWWEALTHQLVKLGITDFDDMTLPPLAETASHRALFFTKARDRFADLMGVSDPGKIDLPANISQDTYSTILALHMAALAAVYASARGIAQLVDADVAVLSSYLLDREREYWQSLYNDGDGPVKTGPATIGRVVYTAILAGPTSYQDGITALDRVGIVNAGEQILGDHSRCYPPDDPGTIMAPLYPDRLGEDYLALQTPGHLVRRHQPDAWAVSAIGELLASVNEKPPPWTRSVLTVLIEVAKRWTHMRERQLWPLLRDNPQLAIAGGSPVLIALAEFPADDLGVLELIEQCFPAHKHVDLDAGIAAISQRLTDKRLAGTVNPIERAQLKSELGRRLMYAGLHERAAAAYSDAAQLYRYLRQDVLIESEASLAQSVDALLAESLDILSTELWNLGQWDEALVASGESIEILRMLVSRDREHHISSLARSLTNQSIWLLALGRPDSALSHVEEAVSVYRGLVEQDSSVHRFGLASALGNLGITLGKLNRRTEALTATREAVEILDSLATINPEAFGHELARILTNMAADLSDIGQHLESIEVSTRALAWHRRLVAVNTTAYGPDFARGLLIMSTALSRVDRSDEALVFTKEAVEVGRRLATANPRAYEGELAEGLTSLAIDLIEKGHWSEALSSAKEAYGILSRLAERNFAKYGADLAQAASAFGMTMAGLERTDDSLNYFIETATIYRRLMSESPNAYANRLYTSLFNLASVLINSKRFHDASRAVGELISLSFTFLQLQMAQYAVRCAEEAVGLSEKIAESEKSVLYELNLGSTLSSFAVVLAEIGMHDESQSPANRAVDILRPAFARDPTTVWFRLLGALVNLAASMLAVGNNDAAGKAATEAVELMRHPVYEIGAGEKGALEVLAAILDAIGLHSEVSEIRAILGRIEGRRGSESI